MELGYDKPKRIRDLQLVLKNDSKGSDNFRFQGKYQRLPINSVPIQLPKYRIENGRTKAKQKQLIASKNYPEDFFEDPEREEVQEAQHQILFDLAVSPSANLLEEFEKSENEQEESLVLSSDGFVVNGNRRLSVFRHLIEKDYKKYQRYKNIDVVILPVCDDRDIDELEAHLQIHKDLKQEYSWVTFALMLRERRSIHGYKVKQLAQLYDKKPVEIKDLISGLGYAEEYLNEINRSNEYDLVEKSRYAFVDGIAWMIRRHKFTASMRRFFIKSASKIIQTSEGDSDYRKIRQLTPEALDNIKSNLSSHHKEGLIETTEDISVVKKEESGLFTSQASKSDVETLKIIEFGNTEDVVETINSTLAEEKLAKETSTHRNVIIRNLQKAHTLLRVAKEAIEKDPDRDREGVRKQITEVAKIASEILEWAKVDD